MGGKIPLGSLKDFALEVIGVLDSEAGFFPAGVEVGVVVHIIIVIVAVAVAVTFATAAGKVP